MDFKYPKSDTGNWCEKSPKTKNLKPKIRSRKKFYKFLKKFKFLINKNLFKVFAILENNNAELNKSLFDSKFNKFPEISIKFKSDF